MELIGFVGVLRSPSFLARVRNSRSFRDAGYAGCPTTFLPRDRGLLIGPVQSVVTVALMVLTSSLYSLTSMILGAILGVVFRFPDEARMPSIVLGSLLNLSGLRGGGPGLSQILCGYSEEAKLDARCNKRG